jgi:hypothetical protein
VTAAKSALSAELPVVNFVAIEFPSARVSRSFARKPPEVFDCIVSQDKIVQELEHKLLDVGSRLFSTSACPLKNIVIDLDSDFAHKPELHQSSSIISEQASGKGVLLSAGSFRFTPRQGPCLFHSLNYSRYWA